VFYCAVIYCVYITHLRLLHVIVQSGVVDIHCVLFIVYCELCCCNMLQSKFFFLTLNIILIAYFSQWMLSLNSDNKIVIQLDVIPATVCVLSPVLLHFSTVGSVTKGIWLIKTSVSRNFHSSSFTTPTGFLSSWRRVISRKVLAKSKSSKVLILKLD